MRRRRPTSHGQPRSRIDGKSLLCAAPLAQSEWCRTPRSRSTPASDYCTIEYRRSTSSRLASHPREQIQAEITGWARAFGLHEQTDGHFPLIGGPDLDREYAMTTNLDQPLIFATLQAPGKAPELLLIDGWHRTYRAHAEGRTHLPGRVLTIEESLAIRCHVREIRR
jgi:hypothetical protein